MTRWNGLTLGFLLLFLAAVAKPGPPATSYTRDIRGEVALFRENPREKLNDASKVAIWLVPLDPARTVQPEVQKQNYRMAQHNKSFEPNFLVVPLGSTVIFPNLDPWFHNVFSLYRGKKFDLGLYEAGSQKEVHFDRPGASYLFCNIHPEMTAVVLTVDSDYFGVSDKSGRVSIPDVPAGTYRFHVWYENAAPQILQSLERTFDVTEGTSNLPAITIPVTKQVPAKHKNKYGRDYDPSAMTPDY